MPGPRAKGLFVVGMVQRARRCRQSPGCYDIPPDRGTLCKPTGTAALASTGDRPGLPAALQRASPDGPLIARADNLNAAEQGPKEPVRQHKEARSSMGCQASIRRIASQSQVCPATEHKLPLSCTHWRVRLRCQRDRISSTRLLRRGRLCHPTLVLPFAR